jgi:hypothetical protein
MKEPAIKTFQQALELGTKVDKPDYVLLTSLSL